MFLIIFDKVKIKTPRFFNVLIFLFFLTQSLSVIGAYNVQAFLSVYKDFIFGLLFLYLSIILINTKHKFSFFIKVMILSIFLNIALELMIFFRDDLVVYILQPFIYHRYWEVLEVNALRNRFFVDFYDAALIPIFFYFAKDVKSYIYYFVGTLGSLAVFFLSLVSNFRSQLFMAGLSGFASILILFPKKKITLILVGVLFAFFLLGQDTLPDYLGRTSLDRLLSPLQIDITTAMSRVNFWGESVNVAIASPFFGIGLGNFYDYYPNKQVFGDFYQSRLNSITLTNPHNLYFAALAESGFTGLIAILALTVYLVVSDFKKFFKGDHKVKLLIASFWSLFSYSMIMPATTLQYLVLFWSLRALIINVKDIKR